MNANTATNTYARVEVESSLLAADPHKLIAMLFQGALLAIANARNSMLRKDIPAKSKAITHAIRIISEGLRASLDKNVGGQLAYDLDALYEYMCVRLVNANLKNDVEILDEVARLLGDIKSAWDEIRPKSNAPQSTTPYSPESVNKQPALVYGRG
ncbi:flagellar export chaperone FliS [Sideroxydans lithotrophicus]|uniref:Flagellar secretion chaperone FliS n=1 Tax=Sideroxydans lithotrophicus (strain ES-1) TaxID=580332 RepID=D5CN21_SIDLE|nr:flagellar export chaperone FliS [Sideroxydans lithotrophicus]ADE10857.1 flagellar protein FliS [Sideroxydans lithotrophicus ES-1]